jgi:hypothetical protein
VRESRARIYTGFKLYAALIGPYGAVRGSAWSGERHVTVRTVTEIIVKDIKIIRIRGLRLYIKGY